jgi:hypothetical protein
MNYPFQEKTDKKRATQKVQLLDVEKSKSFRFFANFETKTEKKNNVTIMKRNSGLNQF